jgi:hypothetical protein
MLPSQTDATYFEQRGCDDASDMETPQMHINYNDSHSATVVTDSDANPQQLNGDGMQMGSFGMQNTAQDCSMITPELGENPSAPLEMTENRIGEPWYSIPRTTDPNARR